MSKLATGYRTYLECRSLWHILNRHQELHDLIAWAEAKRYQAPLRCYRIRLEDEELRLNRHLLRHPLLTNWTRALHAIASALSPTPPCYRKGSAEKYRFSKLTSAY